ncbi:MAG: hypothetical protein BWX56_00299 [Euryarchaeota archaeon ADurb.Bin023]|jgi:hypothetical protein|uniref:Uncharacterized protein n=1 Tax=Candidatus Methanofastidiosum methylothiophilum TaxID=1705564 RepID=A0A150JKL1_9EURY|nr:MAG: hypothetical protein APG09_00962 [Candidatus Methanofastidiosum methylthiophilus]MCC6251426.1 hypothetical protein [Bacteroidia bacterium]NOJ28701.1 hypothetical protein [Nitrososphaeraceae archaeon]OQC52411.1 MAG: hypothetical protein BWX56_00299 [Euryarchaeota archaeon ADurb.Bin023]
MRKLIFLALLLCSLCTFAQNREFVSALYYKEFVLEKYVEDKEFKYEFESVKKVKYKRFKGSKDYMALLYTKQGNVYVIALGHKTKKSHLKFFLRVGYRSPILMKTSLHGNNN